MTGRYCWRSSKQAGVTNGYGEPLIPTDRTTVASLLKSNGYRTAMIGKWHLGMSFPKNGKGKSNINWKGRIEGGPTDLGLDYYFGISASLDMPPYIYIENDQFVGECTTTKVFKRKGLAHASRVLVRSAVPVWNVRHGQCGEATQYTGIQHFSDTGFAWSI